MLEPGLATGNAVANGSTLLPLMADFMLAFVLHLITHLGTRGLVSSEWQAVTCRVPDPKLRSRMFLLAAHSRAD